jgi:hypothetical protein
LSRLRRVFPIFRGASFSRRRQEGAGNADGLPELRDRRQPV